MSADFNLYGTFFPIQIGSKGPIEMNCNWSLTCHEFGVG